LRQPNVSKRCWSVQIERMLGPAPIFSRARP
jgi:hypothetical protein